MPLMAFATAVRVWAFGVGGATAYGVANLNDPRRVAASQMPPDAHEGDGKRLHRVKSMQQVIRPIGSADPDV